MSELFVQHGWIIERQVSGDIEAFLRFDCSNFELLAADSFVASIVVILSW